MELSSEQTNLLNLCPLPLFGFHLDPSKHLMYLFCFSRCPFLGNLGRWIALLNLFISPMPHHVLGAKFGRYYNKYVKRTNFYFEKPSFNRFWWKRCWLVNFNKMLSPLCILYGSVFNLFFFKIINNNECRSRWCSVFSKVLQSFFKFLSYSNRIPRCF